MFVALWYLTLAGWIPFQSVAAWAMMNAPETSESTDVMSDTNKTAMSSACQSTIECLRHWHGSWCSPLNATMRLLCVDECSDYRSFCLKASQHGISVLFPLYDDHIPVVLSPPPVNFIAWICVYTFERLLSCFYFVESYWLQCVIRSNLMILSGNKLMTTSNTLFARTAIVVLFVLHFCGSGWRCYVKRHGYEQHESFNRYHE